MAQTKKPRKIRDLKARLGKTITPGQTGPGAPGAVPPPSAARGLKGPPGLGAPPGLGPRPGVPIPQPRVSEAPPGDPFAAAPASIAPKASEMRIVIDDSAVHDSELGRKKKGLVFGMLALGGVVGLLFGGFAANMNSKNQLYNKGVVAGDNVFAKIREASDTVAQARTFLNAANAAAGGDAAANKAPSVDFQAIESLRALEHPIVADTFARENYILFAPATVDKLFLYYNNVNLLWERLERLANRTLPEARRTALTEAASALANVAVPKGCVPMVVEERWVCALVFVGPGEEEGTLNVRATQTTAQQVPKQLYVGGEEQNLAEGPNEFVILIDPVRSMPVLGEAASEFADYIQELQALNTLVNDTIQLQGELEAAVGEVAALEERFAL